MTRRARPRKHALFFSLLLRACSAADVIFEADVLAGLTEADALGRLGSGAAAPPVITAAALADAVERSWWAYAEGLIAANAARVTPALYAELSAVLGDAQKRATARVTTSRARARVARKCAQARKDLAMKEWRRSRRARSSSSRWRSRRARKAVTQANQTRDCALPAHAAKRPRALACFEAARCSKSLFSSASPSARRPDSS